MKTDILISIIIPVYNVEQYIDKCLRSVFAQSYDNIECIIVNDDTPDRSMEIVSDSLGKYIGPINFKIVNHENNKGLSAARNSGVRNAIGDYLFFLDSDDELFEDSMQAFITCLHKYGNVDFLIGNVEIVGDFCYKPIPQELFVNSNSEILERYISGELYVMAWGKLINRSFFLKEKVWFIDGILHEDEYFSFCLAMYSESVVFVKDLVYRYVIRQNGSITASKNKINLIDYLRIITLKIQLIQKEMPFQNDFAIYSYCISMLYGFTKYIMEAKYLSTSEKAAMLIHVRFLKCSLKSLKKHGSWSNFLKKQIIGLVTINYVFIDNILNLGFLIRKK